MSSEKIETGKEELETKHSDGEALETSADEKSGEKVNESNEDSDCNGNVEYSIKNIGKSNKNSGSIIGANYTLVGRKSVSGQTCSLKTLIEDEVLDPGNQLLTMEYMGAKFSADLLTNGTIRWTDTKQIFSTPSAWVNHCKKIVNPDNSGKTGSAWSTIRYKGKRLDSYKLRWYRKQKKIITNANLLETALANTKPGSDIINFNPSLFKDPQLPASKNNEDSELLKERNIIAHHDLSSRSGIQDLNVMVKCIPFSSLERIQPFTITISTNALLLVDFHCHMTNGEVSGYLGGTWDISSHNLAILQAFPCRSRFGDKDRVETVEEEIRQNLEQRNLNLVGWYHSHPSSAPQPTVKDIESQMEYQLAMKGESDSSYVPTIGLICSPYDKYSKSLLSAYQSFWVMPPPEYKPYEYGKPMQMIHNVARDLFLTQDLLLEMRLLAHFYMEGPDAVKFEDKMKDGQFPETSYWEKLQASLQTNLPRDLQVIEDQNSAQAQVQQQALTHFWAFLEGLIVTNNT